MKIIPQKNFPVLIVLGVLVMVLTQISSHYLLLHDSINGFLMGFSFSLMLLGLVQLVKKRRAAGK